MVGTWSGSTATSAASSALKATCAMHQPIRTTATVGATATTRTPAVPPARPMIIHGRRLPSRDEVRSLILPKNGLANSASSAPTPATSARLVGARSLPTRELIFKARLTSNGARNNRMVPMYASAYSTTNRAPTRCTGGDSGTTSATTR